MNNSINFITNFPDFVTMQRNSFCWFITEGLMQELNFFSSIYDFTKNTEYILFGEEYSLINPPCSSKIARKYNGNYRAQLILPLEIRSRDINSIKYQNKFPIITLPLMTTYATFILNGCERIVVSQIIRSPGIYFEKVSNPNRLKTFKNKTVAKINKLRSFLPSGEAIISENDLFFSIPTKKTNNDKKIKIISLWNQRSVRLYSIHYLRNKLETFPFQFLQFFKFYKIIVSEKRRILKQKLIILFFKWINLNSSYLRRNLKKFTSIFLVNFFKIYFKSILKYKLIIDKKAKTKTKIINCSKILKYLNTKKSLKNFYSRNLFKLHLYSQLEWKKDLVFVLKNSLWFTHNLESFSFLKKQINKLNIQIDNTFQLIELNSLKSKIYFSKSLKNTFKYNPYFFNNRAKHKYLKSKTNLLLFSDEYTIKTSIHSKYDKKDLYNAVLIPEYGSWIRFKFHKNTKLNHYKYPIKYQEETLSIQLDKINQKPIIHVLKEIGFNDQEIYNNLDHSDFFYFTKPLLLSSGQSNANDPILRYDLNSTMLKNMPEFTQIFDSRYYRIGKIGRLQLNKLLNINISQRLQTITYEDLFAIIDKLLTLTLDKALSDDIDHLKNRRVRSIGELMQNLFKIGFQRLERKLNNQLNIGNKNDWISTLSLNLINSTVKEFFASSQLSQYLDQTNPLSSLTHRRRISGLGPGGLDRDRISFAVRDIHPSHYGRICPIETPEGQNVGLIASLTTYARVNKLGFLETPFWRVTNGKVLKTKKPIFLTADIEDLYRIAPADISINDANYLTKSIISIRYKQDFINVAPYEVEFISISSIQIVSIAASLIPFFEHDDANRALMGSNMQRQSVPLLSPQKPIVGTGLENQIAVDSGMTVNALKSGLIKSIASNQVILKSSDGQIRKYKLQKYLRSNQQTCINQRPIVWAGENVKSGQMLTDGPSISMGELSLGQNILVSYMPWQGYNFEDAVLVSEKLVYEDLFTSIHIERCKIEIDRTSELKEHTTKNIPNLISSELVKLNDDGIVRVGTFVRGDDILVGKVVMNDLLDESPESKFLNAIFGTKAQTIKDNSYRMSKGNYGRIIETITFNKKSKATYQFIKIYIFIAQIRKIKVGDKIAGRHGNKGIISRILARQDMPFLPDGTPIDILLNPLGVPSRMNVGQLYECLLGFAGHKLNCRFKILPFDELYGIETSRILINKKLRQASIAKNESWIFNPYAPGKMVLIDGRTGKAFENPVTVGNAYMLKLIHLVDDKMHARATGPYSLITQQPLRGKAQNGGQRFGEMEVWALEGFGAAFTLKELLTVKSDDMQGRNKTLTAVVRGRKLPKFGTPESFKVLLQELKSIGLDLSTYKLEKFSSTQIYQSETNIIDTYKTFSKKVSSDTLINDISF